MKRSRSSVRGAVRAVRRSATLSLLVIAGHALVPGPAAAQEPRAAIQGIVVDDAGAPVPRANVMIAGTARGAITGTDGGFRIGPLPAGTYRLRVSGVGYGSTAREVDLAAGQTAELRIALAVQPIELAGIEVRVLRPDLRPTVELGEKEIREASPQDTGELLRTTPGADAVRRGPLGLDPVVRGLRETQIGTYVDGTRVFPAGPARMDSPLSHFDPYAVRSFEIVKGPYALTWGGGNLTAIRIGSQDLPQPGPTRFGGRLAAGYETNLDARETMASVAGYGGRVAYWLFGAWRDGGDYEPGGGVEAEVPGTFDSWEGRGKLGFDLAPGSRVTVAGGYQDQGPIDYPGRLLTAEFFEHANGSLNWRLDRADGTLTSFDATVYVNDVDHGMSNAGKPTAVPVAGRIPPFALDIEVDTESTTTGGRVAATFAPGPWEIELGGDGYRVDRSAVRTIRRQIDGNLLFEDLVWPDATISDLGAFLRVGRPAGGIRWSGTVRVDVNVADADTISDFFGTFVSDDLEAEHVDPSGALTAGFDLGPNWTLSLGLGSTVRPPDALERYSDRFPATRAQTSAEFVGNPDLGPERSTQADVWLEGGFERVAVQLNAFGRRIEDYITLTPTDLPKRLPLSPQTVFQYVNGEATFYGAEASVALALGEALTATVTGDYLWGEDDSLDEPALGVPPLSGTLELRLEPPRSLWFAEAALHAADRQDRVAEARNEGETPGYATVDLLGGIRMANGLELRVGVDNLLDKAYVNHLNARNPFTTEPVPEPGTVFIVDASVAF